MEEEEKEEPVDFHLRHGYVQQLLKTWKNALDSGKTYHMVKSHLQLRVLKRVY